MCNKKSLNMNTDTNEPFDLNAFKEAKIKQRTVDWTEFYNRYENMGDVGTDEVDWDEESDHSDDETAYSDDEMISNDSSASNNGSADESDDEGAAIEISSDGESGNELSNDDVDNFANVFKDICHKGMETIQREYEERLLEETISKDGTKKTVQRHTISSVNESRAQISTPIRSMNRISSPHPNISRLAIADRNGGRNDGNNLALIPFNGANHGTDVMNMNDSVQNGMVHQNGTTYFKETITETIVKTTVRLVMQPDATTNSTFTTPLKGDSKRQFADNASTFTDDFNEGFTTQETPTANAVRRRVSRRSSVSTSNSVYATPNRKNWMDIAITPKTPTSSGSKNRRLDESLVRGKDLTKSIPKDLLKTPADRERFKDRKILVKEDEQVTVMCQTPQKSQKAITSDSDDILFSLCRNPKPMVIKNQFAKTDS